MRNRQRPNGGAVRSGPKAVHRCAIYTRKSSEEGLEQEFNSLDAQREACEAFILSQKQAGWVAVPDMYDDGGVSGGTLERPALQRLLGDIEAGRVDTVVVYKVDRLTRSLADFAKIVEAFDARGVAFVSVTQQFNTTSSMGRLTLNMLLSFAQFEREVTSERIRDKIAASKQKGMWMGGLPPLGYDIVDRKLVINAVEAETVRHIFQRYVALRSVRALRDELEEAGVVSKARVDRFGHAGGARPIARGALYHMLQNRLYRGEIVHKEAAYAGQHAMIIEADLWDAVQAALVGNRVDRARGGEATATAPSLLTGLVYDGAGERMSPTHANKKGTRYRYYVSQSLIKNRRSKASADACRVPAADLEGIVEGRLCTLLQDEAAIYDGAGAALTNMRDRKTLLDDAADLARRWPAMPAAAKRGMLQALITRITVRSDVVEVEMRLAALPDILATGPDQPQMPSVTEHSPTVIFSTAARFKRTGMETRLLVQGPSGPACREPDRSLLRLLAQARQFRELVMGGQGRMMRDLAAEAGVNASYFTRVFRLGFMAPEIIQVILHGRQPAELTANKLKLAGSLAPAWSEQRRQFGLS